MRLAVEQNHGVITHLSVYEPARARLLHSPRKWRKSRLIRNRSSKGEKLTTVHDSGTVLNRSYQGQIDGGVVTGLGFALMEDSCW
jgi:hypothetical protein